MDKVSTEGRVFAYSLAKEINHNELEEIAGGANTSANNCEYTNTVATCQG
jgi:bacteriocin-like protein